MTYKICKFFWIFFRRAWFSSMFKPQAWDVRPSLTFLRIFQSRTRTEAALDPTIAAIWMGESSWTYRSSSSSRCPRVRPSHMALGFPPQLPAQTLLR